MGHTCDISEAASKTSNGLLFRAVLKPERSASVQYLNTVVLIFATISVPTSVVFAMVGAWPVAGFIGLDIVLLAAFLRYHHWVGRVRETIELSRDALVIKRRDQWGRQRSWRLDPHWARVHLEDVDEHRNRLEFRLRDRVVSVGGFLSQEEKVDLAATLRQKLAQVSALQRA